MDPTRRPRNSRLDFLDGAKAVENKNKKKTFVAMPSERQWLDGFRPAWILEASRDPPENYHQAVKIYEQYIRTGEVSVPRWVKRGDPVKCHEFNYHAQNKARKDRRD